MVFLLMTKMREICKRIATLAEKMMGQYNISTMLAS